MSAPDIDGKVNLSLTYTEIGLVRGALGVTMLGLRGKRAELTMRELEALRDAIDEQVQEQIPDHVKFPGQ